VAYCGSLLNVLFSVSMARQSNNDLRNALDQAEITIGVVCSRLRELSGMDSEERKLLAEVQQTLTALRLRLLQEMAALSN
jgi:hypothetical protein